MLTPRQARAAVDVGVHTTVVYQRVRAVSVGIQYGVDEPNLQCRVSSWYYRDGWHYWSLREVVVGSLSSICGGERFSCRESCQAEKKLSGCNVCGFESVAVDKGDTVKSQG